jgi:ATP-dependent RNA helicase DHX8/PRP22
MTISLPSKAKNNTPFSSPDTIALKIMSEHPNIDNLPIIKYLPEIAESVRNNRATVIIGATGSGKTTQVGLHLLRQGLAGDKRIGVTQPRRLAVISLANFVSELYGCEVGQEVGYQVRFDDSTMEGTQLKFMTDGILLQEASGDPLFGRYNVLIFDEAHEQGLNTDIGLGLVKRALAQRPDLHVVIMSATIDTGRFAEYFDNAPIITVEGRSFPIETQYLQPEEHKAAVSMCREAGPEASLPALAAYKANQVHTSQGDGHILIFMPGKKEIAQTIEYLEDLGHHDWLPLPAHSEMDQPEQQRIFTETGQRKIIVATNIAETSITVDNLAFVIDSGLIRQMTFDHHHGIGALRTIEHSKAGLRQRQGRAGRTRPGMYLPLFTESDYKFGRADYREPNQVERPEYSMPEIQREDLASAVLRMIELGVSDVANFDFMNAPARGAVRNAIRALFELGAVDQDEQITSLGRKMAKLPVEPRIARMILEAQKFGCVDEILTIAACLSTNTIFTRPIGFESQADDARLRLEDDRGDLFTLLKIIPLYLKQKRKDEWCDNNFLNQHVLEEILKVRDQLRNLVEWMDIPITSLRATEQPAEKKQRRLGEYDVIGRAITAGLLQNIAAKGNDREYKRLDHGEMRIHPGSVLIKWMPKIIVCTEILEINGYTFAVNCQAVEYDWIQELAPHLLKSREHNLTHPWKGHVLGTYTVSYLCGTEVARRYSKESAAAAQQVIEMERDRVASEHRQRRHKKGGVRSRKYYENAGHGRRGKKK